MAENSKIEWTTHTFNPWVGCSKIAPPCDFCYAENWARRTGQAGLWNGERRRTSDANWRLPLKWNRQAEGAAERPRVFCASLADVFDNQAEEIWRSDLFALIEDTPNLDWLLLTKRPQNIPKMIWPKWEAGLPSNIWAGSTIGTRAELRNLDHLRAVRARIRFLSCEPLLEDLGEIDLTGIHLVIAGGESGPKARPSHPDWFRSLRDQCAAVGVPFFFKQWGEWREFDTGSAEIDEVDAGTEKAESILALAMRPGWIDAAGNLYRRQADLPAETPCRLIERAGKKRAGAELDGREWREMPRAAAMEART